MDSSEIEKNISELEEKLDRVRALYEQYFCGIEKLEPQIPRKDVDRRIVLLRKEQIRNTAMRFKFNTLVQRYNTMQQHWGRILREIENGTYKRDLARAAARFGLDEALTAVGRKRADRMAAGLKAQLERTARKQPQKRGEDEYEEVADDDVQAVEDDFDDDAPTPPPVVHVLDESATYAPGGGADYGADYGHTPYAAAGYGHPHEGYAQPQATQSAWAAAPAPAASQPSLDPFAPMPSRASRGTTAPIAPGPAWPSSQGIAPPAGPPLAAPPVPAAGGPKEKKAGGLRLGGGPSRRVNSDALNRIASSLGSSPPGALDDSARTAAPAPAAPAPAAPAPAAPAPAVPAPAPAPQPAARRPLLSSPLGLDLDDLGDSGASAPPASAPVSSRNPGKPALSPPPKAPALTPPPGALRPPPSQRDAGSSAPAGASSPAAPARPSQPATPDASPPGEATPDPQRRPAAASLQPRPKPSQPSKEDLSDGRLREIYSQYVQSRRDRNESTAGITFEKLADSLRSQAEKLKSKHTSKRVDYEVVVKEGKTLIKPIVR
jgi:hypothetical protein